VPTSKQTVGFISQDWSKVDDVVYPNGCTWYRCIIPANILNSNGYQSHVGYPAQLGDGNLAISLAPPLYKNAVVADGHDLLVLKLVMHAKVKELLEKKISQGKRVVIDIDDWFDNLPESNRARDTTDPETHPENNRDIYFAIMEMAHALICSTQFLFDFYSTKYPNKPIFLVRNTIDIGRWRIKKKYSGLPKIGWCGATPWRANDLEQLAPFMNDYLKSRNLKFHHSGAIPNAPSVAQLMEVDHERVTVEGMRPITDLPGLLHAIDIGVVPLNNIQFNHAKSYLKGLEYAAAGIPFIASDLPEYRYLADAGVGRIASTPSQWMAHLDELQDASLRRDEAQMNYEIVKDQFSMNSSARQWLSIFEQIMDIAI
jgi:glycosyltransferase involved in cell wall biosynthesis